MDIGWSELLLIGIVALIVVGPQDLPRMFAALGRFTAKARGMAREFQRAMDEAAKESGVSETAKDLRAMTSKKNLGLDKIEEAAKKFESWDPAKSSRAAAEKPAPGPETAKLAEKTAAEAAARRDTAGGAKPSSAATVAAGAAAPAPAEARPAAAAKAAPAKRAAKPEAPAKAAKTAAAKPAKPAQRKPKPKATDA